MPTDAVAAPQVDVLVLGGGAAGLFCAATAGAAGAGSVLVLEKNERPGLKILISGGGRCNFTNRDAGPENYLCGEPAFPRSALARYRPEEFIALVERHGIAYHEKKLGQLFCDGSSRQIVEMLLAECRAAGARVETSVEVTGAARQDDGFLVTARDGRRWRARRLVVATGGLSFPKLGRRRRGAPHRAGFRAADRPATSGAGAADLRRPGAGTLRGPQRGRLAMRRAGGRRRAGVRGGAAVHAPRV